MSLNAGQVFVELGGKLDPAAFAKYEAATKKAATDMETAEKRIDAAAERVTAAIKASSAEQIAAMKSVAATQQEQAAAAQKASAVQAAAQREQAAAARQSAAQIRAAEKQKQQDVASSAKATNLALATVAIGGALFAKQVFKATQVAGDFDQQIRRLGARSDATQAQLGKIRKAALDLGTSMGTGAREAAKGATELVKGGLSVQKVLAGGLKGALALAVAGEMDVADASTTVANALNEFKLKGEDATHIADALATAANATTADVSDFAIALTQGGAAAKTAGLSFDETTAFLEALASAGVKGSDAGTSMKTALVQLANPTKQASDLMHKLGLDFFDAAGNIKPLPALAGMLRDKLGGLTKEQRLQTASTLAGTDGMRGLLALYDAGPKGIKKFEEGLKAQGTAARVAAAQNEGAAGAARKLKAAWEEAQIIVGTELLPEIAKGADQVTAKLKEMAADGSLKQMGDDLAKIAENLGEKLPDALDKTQKGVNNFGKAVDLINDLNRASKFILTGVFTERNPFAFMLEGARTALVAIKALAVARDLLQPGDQSGAVKSVQGQIDKIDGMIARVKHQEVHIFFTVDSGQQKKIFDLVDQLDSLGKKKTALNIVENVDSAQGAIEGLQLAIKGVPEKRILNIIARSQSAQEQVAAFNALANGVPAKRVTEIQAKSKTAYEAIVAFKALATGVPERKVTSILANTGSARQAIGDLTAAIAAVPSSKNVTITTTRVNHLIEQVEKNPSNYTVKKRAMGGKTDSAQLAWIGEGRDPVEWVIPRDPQYRSRAVGLLMDAAKSILPGHKKGTKTGGRYIPPKLEPQAYNVDDFDTKEKATKTAIDSSKRIRKNLENARTQLSRAERMPAKTAKQKAARKDSIDQANRRIKGYRDDLAALPAHGDLANLRALWAERKTELRQAKTFQSKIDLETKRANNARDLMALADKRGDGTGYEKARRDQATALTNLQGWLEGAEALTSKAGNVDRALDLQGTLQQIASDLIDNASAAQTDDAGQREADTGMTDAERAVLARINKDISLAALTTTLDDDTSAAKEKASFLQGILGAALNDPARGGDTAIADLADQLKQANDNVTSLTTGGTANDNADLQAQIDQANARTQDAADNQAISDRALAAFQGWAAGPGAGTVINVNTLHPGDPKVWAALAQTANAGNDLAPSRRPLSVKVGL